MSTQRCGLDRGGLDRLAGLGGDRQRQVLDPLGDQLGGAVEQSRRARAGGSRRSGRPRGRRSIARSTSAGVAHARPGRRRCRRRGSRPRPTRRSRPTRRRRGACDRPPPPSALPFPNPPSQSLSALSLAPGIIGRPRQAATRGGEAVAMDAEPMSEPPPAPPCSPLLAAIAAWLAWRPPRPARASTGSSTGAASATASG